VTSRASFRREPETYARQILLWMGSVDEAGVPSYLSFWGYDYASRRGVGNYYSTNLFTLLASRFQRFALNFTKFKKHK
jgi:hypothetical protein